tara:strand:- start:1462 stop:1674 length:213 start_codon:yes stop_codon:yes gene_type:complete
MGWLLKMFLLEDRFILILLRLIKIGFVRTKSRRMNGFSFVFGISKIECQINLSSVKSGTTKVSANEVGRA